MPIKWTTELDAILLHGVFEECNISFGKALCAKIAERVNATGVDVEVSAKAIENRLYSWKKKNVSGNTGLNADTNGTPTKQKPATPKAKTPRGRTKATPKKKVINDSDSGPEGPMDDDEEAMSPSAARGKRSLTETSFSYAEPTSEAEDGGAPKAKHVKTEPAEDHDNSFDSRQAGESTENKV